MSAKLDVLLRLCRAARCRHLRRERNREPASYSIRWRPECHAESELCEEQARALALYFNQPVPEPFGAYAVTVRLIQPGWWAVWFGTDACGGSQERWTLRRAELRELLEQNERGSRVASSSVLQPGQWGRP